MANEPLNLIAQKLLLESLAPVLDHATQLEKHLAVLKQRMDELGIELPQEPE